MRKCQIHECKNIAKKCIKKGTISNGMASSKDFWHCDEHDCHNVEKEFKDKNISIQMKNPFCDVKSAIKIRPKTNK
jgi:hypothetical protein